LEVRRARPRQRAAAEERPAQIRGTAAGAADDALRRALERRAAPREDARFLEDLARAAGDGGLQLGARGSVERVLRVGADLRVDAELAQQREGAARGMAAAEVEVHRELAPAAQVPDPGGMEERRDLGGAAAAPARRDRRELVAHVLRERH